MRVGATGRSLLAVTIRECTHTRIEERRAPPRRRRAAPPNRRETASLGVGSRHLARAPWPLGAVVKRSELDGVHVNSGSIPIRPINGQKLY